MPGLDLPGDEGRPQKIPMTPGTAMTSQPSKLRKALSFLRNSSTADGQLPWVPHVAMVVS